MRRRVLLLAALTALFLPFLAAIAPASAAPVPGSQLISCDRAAERIVVTVSSHLDPACTYTGGVDVTSSGVVLDCQGALIRNTESSMRGIEVVTPADVPLSGVTVRRCNTEGFLNGMRITRTGFRQLAAGHEYDAPLSGVVIENSTVRNSRGVGIFVDGYVSEATVRNTTVTGAGSSGIYLEAGSRNNVVEDNAIRDNGFRENGPNGSVFTLGGQTFRFWGPGREGISVDGSYGNRIARNSLSGNSAGGIFLYTNCGEFVNSRPDRWFQRRFGADDNVIERNTFLGGPVGVWVGARMGENTYPMECSDPAYVSGPLTHVSLDRAAGNTVQDNSFVYVTYGVRVEDDGTSVLRNRFEGPDATYHAVIVGTRVRTDALDHPVRDAIVAGNESVIVDNPDPYRWVHGTENLAFAVNRVRGRNVGICEAPTVPYNALIFVHAVAVQDPNGPPVPKPDYEVPTLGALEPCAPAPK